MRIASQTPVTLEEFEAGERAHREEWLSRPYVARTFELDVHERAIDPEHKRAQSRYYNQRYRLRRKGLRPNPFVCNRCNELIARNDLAILGAIHGDRKEIHLDPYIDLSNKWRWTGAFHEWCLPPLPQATLPVWVRSREATCEVCTQRVRPPRCYSRRDGHGYVYYCSPGCGPAALNLARRTEPEARECETCGETFTPKRRDAVTCSPACRQKAHRRRHALDQP